MKGHFSRRVRLDESNVSKTTAIWYFLWPLDRFVLLMFIIQFLSISYKFHWSNECDVCMYVVRMNDIGMGVRDWEGMKGKQGQTIFKQCGGVSRELIWLRIMELDLQSVFVLMRSPQIIQFLFAIICAIKKKYWR